MNTSVLLIIGIAILVFVAFFAGVGLKMWLGREKEVRGSCSSRNALLNEEDCSVCGRKDDCGGQPSLPTSSPTPAAPPQPASNGGCGGGSCGGGCDSQSS